MDSFIGDTSGNDEQSAKQAIRDMPFKAQVKPATTSSTATAPPPMVSAHAVPVEVTTATATTTDMEKQSTSNSKTNVDHEGVVCVVTKSTVLWAVLALVVIIVVLVSVVGLCASGKCGGGGGGTTKISGNNSLAAPSPTNNVVPTSDPSVSSTTAVAPSAAVAVPSGNPPVSSITTTVGTPSSPPNVCTSDADCSAGECAVASIGSTQKVCCATGQSTYLYSPVSQTVCTGQAAGAPCSTTDSLCASGVCYAGRCLAGKQPNGQACDSNGDCEGTCVGGICGDSFRPARETCDDDDDCANGECAYQALEGGSISTHCCPTGESVFLYSPISRKICDAQPAGASCGESNSLCASGVCFQGRCLAGQQPAGSLCKENDHCVGTCVGGACVEGFLAAEETCDDDGDCANGECGHKTLDGNEVYCCPTGESVFLYSPISRTVCKGQANGASCASSSELCASGVCFQGRCLEGKQPNGQPCAENGDCEGTCVGAVCVDGFLAAEKVCDDDGDCANGECGHKTISSGDLHCCPTGGSVYFYSPISRTICDGQVAGASCGESDDACASNVCVQGTCRDAKQPNGQPCDGNSDCVGTCVGGTCVSGFLPVEEVCDDDKDCANGQCAYKTAAGNEIHCCTTGKSTFLSSPVSRTVCTGQAAGMPCGTANSVCISGKCPNGICE